MIWIRRLCLILSVLLLAGCGSAETSLTGTSTGELLGGKVSGDFGLKLQEAEQRWQQRDQQSDLEAAIKAWEEAIEIETPSLSEEERRAKLYAIYVRLSRAYFLYGDLVLPLSMTDKTALRKATERAFARGRKHAERALAVYSPKFFEAIQAGEAMGAAAEAHLDAGAVAAMFWWATDLGRWLELQSGFTALSYLDDMKRVSHRAHALDEAYFYHSTTSYMGGYYTRLPISTGGDLPRSRRHFEAATSAAPGCLQHQVSFASLYAVQAEDRALFEQLLQGVLAADPNIEPDLIPENRLQQQIAQRLLDKASLLFP